MSQRLTFTKRVLAAALYAIPMAAGAMFSVGCLHHHHDDHVVVTDERGFRHEGYYDRDHVWHGGWYDERHGYHEDPHDWRR